MSRIDRNELNEKNIPEFAKLPKEDSLIWLGAPRQYRADGQMGVFYVGDETQEQVQVQLLEWRWDYSARWGRSAQSWLDLAFVDEQRVVSVLSLKKESAINVFEFLTSLKTLDFCEVHPTSLELVLEMEARPGEEGTYFVVDVGTWHFAEEKAFREARAFTDIGLFEWVLLGEVG